MRNDKRGNEIDGSGEKLKLIENLKRVERVAQRKMVCGEIRIVTSAGNEERKNTAREKEPLTKTERERKREKEPTENAR